MNRGYTYIFRHIQMLNTGIWRVLKDRQSQIDLIWILGICKTLRTEWAKYGYAQNDDALVSEPSVRTGQSWVCHNQVLKREIVYDGQTLPIPRVCALEMLICKTLVLGSDFLFWGTEIAFASHCTSFQRNEPQVPCALFRAVATAFGTFPWEHSRKIPQGRLVEETMAKHAGSALRLVSWGEKAWNYPRGVP